MGGHRFRPRTHRLMTKRAMINEQPQAVPLNGDHVCAARNSSCLMVSHDVASEPGSRPFGSEVPRDDWGGTGHAVKVLDQQPATPEIDGYTDSICRRSVSLWRFSAS